MPIFEIENPQTKQIVKIEADRAPTQEEAQEFLSLETPATATPTAPLSKNPGLREAPQSLSPEDAKFRAEQTVIRDELLARGIDPISRLTPEGILPPLTEIGTGTVATAPLGQPRAFVEGLGRGTSLALTDALAKLALNPDFKAENQPRVQFPATFTLGETIGSTINPLSKAKGVSTPLTLGAKVLAGARAFAPLGALAGAAGAVADEGTQTEISDFLTQTLLGAGLGAGLGGAVPVVGKTIGGAYKGLKSVLTGNAVTDATVALEKAGLIKAPEAIAVDLLNPSGEGAVRNVAGKIVEGNVTKPFQIVKETAGQFSTLPEFVDQGEKTLLSLGKEIDPIIKNNPSIRVPMQDASKAMIDEVTSQPLLVERNPELVDLVTKNAKALDKDFSLEEAYTRLKEINANRKNYFTATTKGQTTKLQDAEFAADEIQRKYLSGKLNDVTEGITGLERNPFREYGQVGEAVENVTKRFYDALVARSKETSKGGVVSNFIKNFDISKPLSSLSLPVDFLRGGELGRLNRRVASLYDKLAQPEELIPLTVAQRVARLQGKIATPPLTPQAQAAANQAQAAQTLQQQIQAAQQANAQTNVLPFNPQPSPAQVQATQALQQPLYDAEAQAIQQAQQQGALQRRLQELIQQSEASQEADILRLQKQLGGSRRR